MRFSTISLFALSGFVSQSLATVFVTNPIAGTTVTAGKPFTITWDNNEDAPTDFGNAEVALFVGSTNVQAQVASLAPSVATGNVTSLNVTIDPTVGENYPNYFLRFTSTTAQDPKNPQNFAEAFSATFPIQGMTGQFNPAQKTAIASLNATSTPNTASAPPSTPGNANTNAVKPTSSSSSSSSTTGKPAASPSTTTKPTNGAVSTGVRMALFGAILLSSAGLLL